MRNILQVLAALLWPVRPQGSGQDPKAIWRPLIVLAIVLYCGPEVFAAADLILLLDILGVTLFLTAFNAGFRTMLLTALARVQSILFPADWAGLIRSRNPPTVVTHGLVLVGFNALFTVMPCLIAMVAIVEVVRAVA